MINYKLMYILYFIRKTTYIYNLKKNHIYNSALKVIIKGHSLMLLINTFFCVTFL